MQAILFAAAAAAAALLAAPAPASASTRLAQEKQCVQCHAPDRHAIGPSFQAIRAIYVRMDQPEARLIAMMRDGSDANLGPHWGKARMPNGSERPPVSDREARQLARWILRGSRPAP
jgi:cytochrome c